MNILAFDSCFGAVSAAVRWQTLLGEWVQHEAIDVQSGGNAERLFQVIERVLEASALDLQDIERIAVTLGPGTFTGLRVGVGAARGLALATGKPVVGLSSLAATAAQARRLSPELNEQSLVVAMDARREAHYVQLFGPDGTQLTDAGLFGAAEAALHISGTMPGKNRIHIVGSGAEPVADALRALGLDTHALLTDIQPHAGALALLAPQLAPLSTLVPIYLRQPDAKEPAQQPHYVAQP
jgi:tRNA threonylcarbamoyladenosine biosynthesis protein TsaB